MLHWEPGNTGEIFISDDNPIDSVVVGKRPAISFNRSHVQSSHLGYDDMQSFNFETGAKKKSILLPGIMAINCCSTVDLEAEYVAWVVFEHLWALRDVLIRQGFFEIGRNMGISPVTQAGSLVANDNAREWYCCTVTSPFQFQRTDKISPLASKVVSGMGMSVNGLTNRRRTPGFPYQQGADPAVHISSHVGDSLMTGSCSAAVPHPLDPTQQVVIRAGSSNRPGIRPPSLNGRVLPTATTCVGESSGNSVPGATVKI